MYEPNKYEPAMDHLVTLRSQIKINTLIGAESFRYARKYTSSLARWSNLKTGKTALRYQAMNLNRTESQRSYQYCTEHVPCAGKKHYHLVAIPACRAETKNQNKVFKWSEVTLWTRRFTLESEREVKSTATGDWACMSLQIRILLRHYPASMEFHSIHHFTYTLSI